MEIPPKLPDPELISAQNELDQYMYKHLSAKQREFLEVYFESKLDVVVAAKASGLVQFNATDREAKKAGNKVLYLPPVTKAVQLALQLYSNKTKIQVEDLLAELMLMARSNMADYFEVDASGNARVNLPATTDRSKYAAVKSIKITTFVTKGGETITNTHLELWDKNKSLDTLLKVARMLNDDDDDSQKQQVHIENVNIMAVPQGKFLTHDKSIEGEIVK